MLKKKTRDNKDWEQKDICKERLKEKKSEKEETWSLKSDNYNIQRRFKHKIKKISEEELSWIRSENEKKQKRPDKQDEKVRN